MVFLLELNHALKSGALPEKIYKIFCQFYESYAGSLHAAGFSMHESDHLFEMLLRLVKEQLVTTHQFGYYHKKVTSPYDYHRFGLEFIRPLVDTQRSHIYQQHNIQKMDLQLKLHDNVILFANHQTEVDPQLISLALEKTYPKLVAEIIFVAGDRVLTDPMAIPFSMGCNLLCIYSKRHIANPPEKKEEKLLHNQKTMHLMKELLSEGGKCIYVAPSGGRDRPNAQGEVEVASFDPQSIEMIRLMAKQASKPTHFYPLSLATFDILPPPQAIESEVGERRLARRGGSFFAFGDEIDMEVFPGSEISDRHAKREARAAYIHQLVKTNYDVLCEIKKKANS